MTKLSSYCLLIAFISVLSYQPLPALADNAKHQNLRRKRNLKGKTKGKSSGAGGKSF
jgi:hypothetical protein